MKKAGILILLFLLAGYSGCTSQTVGSSSPRGAVKMPPPPVPVTAGRVVKKSVPLKIHAIGNVQAYSTVTVKALIGGNLTHVNFKEGQFVNKGDLLFAIDSRPYEAQLKQAEANLAKDKAQAENARQEAKRYKELVANGYVAQEQYEQISANAEAMDATVLADESAVENARLQVEYCFIRSPIDGVTGNLLVHEGNLVKANDVSLVVINQVRPIYVAFSVPGPDLPAIKQYSAEGPLKVEVSATEKEPVPVAGEMVFVDNAVDLQTGTIQLKGLFPNSTKALWPGQFVNVDLVLSHLDNAVVVPSQAVQAGQSGQYLFVIKADQTVETRPVVVSKSIGEESVVEKGVEPGETVVVDGQVRLVPGAKVAVKN